MRFTAASLGWAGEDGDVGGTTVDVEVRSAMLCGLTARPASLRFTAASLGWAGEEGDGRCRRRHERTARRNPTAVSNMATNIRERLGYAAFGLDRRRRVSRCILEIAGKLGCNTASPAVSMKSVGGGGGEARVGAEEGVCVYPTTLGLFDCQLAGA